MGSNLLLRGAKEGVSRHVWRGEGDGGLRDPTATLSLLPLHSFTATLCTPFWLKPQTRVCLACCLFRAHASSLSGESLIRTCLFVCPLLTVRYKTLSRTLPSSQLQWRFSTRRWGLKMARNLLVRLQLWIRPPSRLWSRSSNLERSKHSCPVWTTQKAVRRRSVSRRICVAARSCIPPNTAVASTTELSQAVAQVVEAVREAKASASQRVQFCDHLDPMDKLEVEPPDADQQVFWRANNAKLKGGSPCSVHDGTACRHVCQNGYHPPRNLGPGSPRMGDGCRRRFVTKLLKNKLTARSPCSSCRVFQTTTRGPLAGAFTASYFGKETRPREVEKFCWSCHPKRWRTTEVQGREIHPDNTKILINQKSNKLKEIEIDGMYAE